MVSSLKRRASDQIIVISQLHIARLHVLLEDVVNVVQFDYVFCLERRFNAMCLGFFARPHALIYAILYPA